MKRRLFLTGPMGCGKSTAIARALGTRLPHAGGFLTRRYREPTLHFTLESPDGSLRRTFLDFPAGQPRLDMSVFRELGTELLAGSFLVLDEIGGMELLCPEFMAALNAVLESPIPVIGVIKGAAPANALSQTLGLSQVYDEAARQLRSRLESDENTLVYECGQFDENALILAENWVKEYAR